MLSRPSQSLLRTSCPAYKTKQPVWTFCTPGGNLGGGLILFSFLMPKRNLSLAEPPTCLFGIKKNMRGRRRDSAGVYNTLSPSEPFPALCSDPAIFFLAEHTTQRSVRGSVADAPFALVDNLLLLHIYQKKWAVFCFSPFFCPAFQLVLVGVRGF